MKLCIIPARGGSKRIPRKNIKYFNSLPIIAWSIKAAKSSGVFDHVIVSTDDEDIADIGRTYGADVPFFRPAELSDDYSGLTAVIRHSITWSKEQGKEPDIVACVYATAPFVSAKDLDSATSLLEEHPESDYVLAVTSFPSAVERAFLENGQGHLNFLWPEFANKRSQDLHETYHDAGHFLIGRASAFMQYETSMAGTTLPYKIPRIRCQDIDTPEDWDHAEALFAFIYREKLP